VMLKGLPLSYNRDLQEDKEPFFDSYRQVSMVLAALSGAYETMTINAEVTARAADDQFMVAIDIAEELVGEGVPFRQAHERVGKLVGEAVTTNRSLREVVAGSPDHERFIGLFEPGVALARRRSPGASGPEVDAVQRQLLLTARHDAGERLMTGDTETAQPVVGPFL